MPPKLPGLYWDESRNRYFPESSRPKPPPPAPRPTLTKKTHQAPSSHLNATPSSSPSTSTTSQAPQSLERKRYDTPWRSAELIRGLWSGDRRERAAHEILASHYADTSRVKYTRAPTYGKIKAFCTTTINGEHRRFLGDDSGWLYSSSETAPVPGELSLLTQPWLPEVNLHPTSEISSICISGSHCVATCFGATAKISVQDLNIPGRTYLLTLNNVHDVWNAHLQGKALVLGANRQAVYIPDIDVAISVQHIHTGSDVFSVTQQDTQIYTGARNGTIERHDMRLPKHRSQKLFDERFTGHDRSSVVHLDIMADSTQLLISQVNGDLASYDLRFSGKSTPVVIYAEHVNSYTRRLGICIDHSNDFLFAAGEDSRVRGWSLASGSPLCPSPPSSVDPTTAFPVREQPAVKNYLNPFATKFAYPVEAMQMSLEGGSTCLWIASGDGLYQYRLGEKNLLYN
ncbi:hypothetical protein BDQ12DRAFT_450504 [Crucibulum laeve]|uniref:WD40-repeat-containing domain protein n=1 Tax=Crucibulum laeve TaxID=68775 RepID=A0A5C3LK57_9AGAR|nr:hypothetical protein BDQ12DRAFT_450504 [Crucibulum laeve]